MWKCPACETLNNEDMCVICGEPKPTAEEIARMEMEEKARSYEPISEATYSPALAAKKLTSKGTYSPALAAKKAAESTPTFSPALAAKRAAAERGEYIPPPPTPAPYKEIVTGESIKKWVKRIVIGALIALAIWGAVAWCNAAFDNPESVVDDFEECVDTNTWGMGMIKVFPEPIQRLNSMDSSVLYELSNFLDMKGGMYNEYVGYYKITNYDIEVTSKTKCKGQELYEAQSNLNDRIQELYARSGERWSDYISIDGAYKLYILKDVTIDGEYDESYTDYIEVYVYKIDGVWYLDYNPELFYQNY